MNSSINLISESPDKAQVNGKWSVWNTADATTFIISPDFSATTSVKGYTHGRIMNYLNKLTSIKNTFKFPKEIEYNGIKIKGDLESIRHIISKGEEYRSVLLRYSAAHKANIIVGRMWLKTRVISVWNNINDISLNSLTQIQKNLDVDGSKFIWEVFEKNDGDIQPVSSQYTLDDLENKILNSNSTDFEYHGETKPTENNTQWDQLHLTTPDKKGNKMKAMGIKPKAAMGAERRFAMGESVK